MEKLDVTNLDSNQKLVLQQIFNNELISRIQISKNLGINKATISSILNKLKEKKLVNEVGQGKSTKSGGRKPIILEINKNFGYVISLDIAYHSIEIIYSYFNGELLKYESIPLANQKITHVLELLKYHINADENFGTHFGLLGIAISVHGIVNNEQEIIHLPFHELEKVSMIESIKEIADVPVIVENEANFSAIYECNVNNSLEINNLITLSIHKGIGAGLIIDQKLYRGVNGEAGEIGKTLVSSIEDNERTYHKIEDLCSQDALVNNINKRLNTQNTLSELKKMYYERNEIVLEEIQQFSIRIAILMYNLNMQLNPKVIYINCPLINEIPDLLDNIKTTFNQYTQKEIEISLTSNVKFATLFGATLAITQKILDIENIKLNF